MAVRTGAGAVTVRVVEPLVAFSVALIVVDPIATLVASPVWSMVATAGLEEAQLTVFVRSCWLPSLYVPAAVNGCVFPTSTDGFTGLTVMLAKVADVIVRVAVFEIDPDVAVIVVWPGAAPVANPLGVMVAIGLAELQITDGVRF